MKNAAWGLQGGRNFFLKKRAPLADHMEVVGTKLANGLLTFAPGDVSIKVLGLVLAVRSSEPLTGACALHLRLSLATRPAFDPAQPRAIEGVIFFRCRAIFHAEETPQFDPESGRHVTDADTEVVTPATEIGRMATRRHVGRC
ncbi:MAG TPA: hypothetical protein VK635_02745 [Bradyrhizobium sp.]|nr:hypothetical protein [Bradyrhizobium sp.]